MADYKVIVAGTELWPRTRALNARRQPHHRVGAARWRPVAHRQVRRNAPMTTRRNENVGYSGNLVAVGVLGRDRIGERRRPSGAQLPHQGPASLTGMRGDP